MPDHKNTHNKEKLSELFKMLSMRNEQKQITEGLQESKKLKKRVRQKAGLIKVSKKLRKDVGSIRKPKKSTKKNAYLIFLKKHKGKPIEEIRELWKKSKQLK